MSAGDYLDFKTIAVGIACICVLLLLTVQIDLKKRLDARLNYLVRAKHLRRSGSRLEEEPREHIVSWRQVFIHLSLMRVAIFLLWLFNGVFWLKVFTSVR